MGWDDHVTESLTYTMESISYKVVLVYHDIFIRITNVENGEHIRLSAKDSCPVVPGNNHDTCHASFWGENLDQGATHHLICTSYTINVILTY